MTSTIDSLFESFVTVLTIILVVMATIGLVGRLYQELAIGWTSQTAFVLIGSSIALYLLNVHLSRIGPEDTR